MWKRKAIGLVLAACGVAVFSALLYPSFSHSLNTGTIFNSSIPVALLTGMSAVIAFVFGVHLLLPAGLRGLFHRG